MEILGKNRGSGLAPNIASVIAYFCPPLTSVVILLLERENKEVQFHAWQGILFGGGYIGVMIALQIFSVVLGAIASFLGIMVSLLIPLFGIGAFVIWIVCLVKAYQGERWKIPYLGDIAVRRSSLE